MIVKNWMSKNPNTISSDLTAKDALFMFEETRVPFISVVDDKKFRGFIARRDLREAASWAISTQDINEIQYFNEKLKVKDIMVRKPLTLSIHDTVETALEKGKQFGRTFLPVMDGNTLVGTLSNRDLTRALNQLLGSGDSHHSISVELDMDANTGIRKLMEEIFEMGLKIKGLFTLKEPDNEHQRLIIRFEAKCLKRITNLLEEKGYNIIEVLNQGK